MAEKLTVTFYGGTGSVTGANFLLSNGSWKVLIDCGLFQGSSVADENNVAELPYNPAVIDVLLVTHAHLDHVGRIPKLVRDGFRGVIYSTLETKEVAELILQDALYILTHEAEQKGQVPLYELADVQKAFSLWKTSEYHKTIDVVPGLKAELKDAGHVLGSTMYELLYTPQNGPSRKVVFTGDLGNSPSPLLADTEEITDADYVIMESVYGDRNHETKVGREEKFQRVIKDAIARKGVLVVPAFSFERTQIILYELNNFIEDGKVPCIPVYLDSPLGIKITEIYDRTSKYYNPAVQREIFGGDDIFKFPKLQMVLRADESKALAHSPNPKIIIAGSGMSTGGRVIHHELNYLPDPHNTILLMGYQALGTLGRHLLEGSKTVKIYGQEVAVRAHIEMIDGYSGHKDSDNLVDFVDDTKKTAKAVFVVMGEPKASLFLVQRLKDYLGVNAVYPEYGKEYELK
ncbi:MAG: MBL fold metallo-hydrolase [Candidatus Paceibacterota bacterium]|jgi:metallo-beta-lactamase family protein